MNTTQLHKDDIKIRTEAELQEEIAKMRHEIGQKLRIWSAAFPEEDKKPIKERVRDFFIWFLNTKRSM